MTVRRLFLSPLWLIVSLPGYIGWRLLPALSLDPVGVAVGIALLLCFCVIIPLSVMTRSIRHPKLAERLAWVGLIAMGFFSSLFVLTVLRDVFLLGVYLLPFGGTPFTTVAASARWTLTLTVFVTLTGFIIARWRPGIVEVEIPVSGLPKALHGFSIAQISDVHVARPSNAGSSRESFVGSTT